MVITRILLALAGLVIAASAMARDPDNLWANSPFHQWFLAQKQEPEPDSPYNARSCCGDGDGHILPMNDLKSLGNGRYMVRIKGVWMLYPKTVDPTHENPTGQTWIWYAGENAPDDITFYCLRLSIGM